MPKKRVVCDLLDLGCVNIDLLSATLYLCLSIYELSINMQIEPILSGNLPPGFDSSTCRSV